MPDIDWWEHEYVDIPWFEWCYDINELWQIRTYWKRTNKWATLTKEPQGFIKPRTKWSKRRDIQFAAVTLYNWLTNTKKKFYVWRLVAKLFMGYDMDDKSKQICHIDWNGMNCAKSNLYIWTVSERATNFQHPWFLFSKVRHDRRNHSKVRAQQIY